jgi:tetratricopeptide (TPR) repeat protein
MFNDNNTLLENDNDEDAIDFFEEAIKLNQKIDYYVGCIAAYVNLKKFDKSFTLCDKALKLDSKNVDILDKKGLSLHNLGRYQEALAVFDQALELDNKLYIRGHRIDTYVALGMPPEQWM